MITIATRESEAHRRNIPEERKRFIYRLFIIYALGTLVISVIVPYDDLALMQVVSNGTKDAGASPFVVGIKRAGIKGLDHVINAVVLTSAWSAANSFLFAGSSSLYSLALTGQAPKIFRTCSKSGILYISVLCTAALPSLTYLGVSSGSATIFSWFLNLTTISGSLVWIAMFMAISYVLPFLSSKPRS